jgi:hypothetical protein|nr:MAG TPA: GABH AIV/GABH BLL coil heterodimer, DE NOVO.9A [Caudoviricetes sp.]
MNEQEKIEQLEKEVEKYKRMYESEHIRVNELKELLNCISAICEV